MNENPSPGPEDNLQSDEIERRGASDLSYTYRPTPIHVNPQHSIFLSSSLPSINITPPSVTNRHTTTHQGLETIEEDEMGYDASGKFTMNARAPVFVPRLGGQRGRGGEQVRGGHHFQQGERGMLPPLWKPLWDSDSQI